MKNFNYLTMLALAALAINVTSCKKEDDTNPSISSDEITVLQDDAQVNDVMDDMDNEADDVMDAKSSELKSGSPSDSTDLAGRDVVVTLNPDGSRTCTITYTNFQNPKAKNERIKNGIIKIVVTGKRSENTYKRVVTFIDFTINGNKIEGTKTIEKVSDLKYKITLENGKVTFTASTFVTCNSVRTRTMVAGSATPLYIWDDAYTFEGSASGTTRKGIAYSKTITIPIKIYTSYRFPVEGSFTLTLGEKSITLDYGDGTLDNIATLTKNGKSKEITLRK
jgi:hypothetical protein